LTLGNWRRFPRPRAIRLTDVVTGCKLIGKEANTLEFRCEDVGDAMQLSEKLEDFGGWNWVREGVNVRGFKTPIVGSEAIILNLEHMGYIRPITFEDYSGRFKEVVRHD